MNIEELIKMGESRNNEFKKSLVKRKWGGELNGKIWAL